MREQFPTLLASKCLLSRMNRKMLCQVTFLRKCLTTFNTCERHFPQMDTKVVCQVTFLCKCLSTLAANIRLLSRMGAEMVSQTAFAPLGTDNMCYVLSWEQEQGWDTKYHAYSHQKPISSCQNLCGYLIAEIFSPIAQSVVPQADPGYFPKMDFGRSHSLKFRHKNLVNCYCGHKFPFTAKVFNSQF